MNNIFNLITAKASFVVILLMMCVQSLAQSETSYQPLPFLEGNPIWVYKHEKISRYRHPYLVRWIDDGNRRFAYYFIGDTKEIDGKVYTMMGEVISDREGRIFLNRWHPVREENGIVYAITDSLQGIVEYYYDDDYPMPYLQEGNECVLYNFGTKIGETLYPQNEGSTVKSFGTYQLLDGTECRVLNTNWGYFDLYEKLGFLSDDYNGIMDPLLSLPISLDGSAYSSRLNAFYQDYVMLYKAPDAQEGLCVNDTCWTREDAGAYARSYKTDPRQEEVFSYIRQLQKASEVKPVTFTAGQMATIILPTVPDAGKGKYYRLDKCEDGKIIFEQELQPQARVPYIIVPNEDFSIDPGTLNLEGLTQDAVSIDGISFIGTYTGEVLPSLGGEGSYYDIIDTTPDCQAEEGKAFLIGALRAYLLVNWDDPINHPGSKDPGEKLEIVLKDKGTSIEEIKNEKIKIKNEGSLYDFQGRRLSGKPERGIYIEDGKKKVMR